LAQLIEGNRSSPYELELFGQELFIQAEATGGLKDIAYLHAQEESRRLAREAIDQLLKKDQLDVLVSPTSSPGWRVDLVEGDGRADAQTTVPAVAGYPHLTVPMGQVHGLPVGLSFIGTAWSEARLLAAGYAFGERMQPFQPPKLLPSLEDSLLASDRDDIKSQP
jgi:amidase